ncbi:MAG: dTDP-4-dehydrorhamnose 3,5-epimerase [Muribaculaceae bacterium]
MKFTQLDIQGVWLIEPVRYGDSRGYFSEVFRQEEFREATGVDIRFIQDNESVSSRGVLRGLHMQGGEFAQAKLVRVSQGAVFDVAVDLRPGSPTRGRWVGVELSQENGRQLFIPRGFAHGFLVLSDMAQFQYKVDNVYAPQSEVSVRYDDPDLGITWPEVDVPLNLSPKDEKARPLKKIL